MNEADERAGSHFLAEGDGPAPQEVAQDQGCPQCRLGNHHLCLNPSTSGCCCGGEPSRVRLSSPAQFPRPPVSSPTFEPRHPELFDTVLDDAITAWRKTSTRQKLQTSENDFNVSGLSDLFSQGGRRRWSPTGQGG